ncbi:MAG: hypothetical protein ACLTYN_14770 [Dysosmobacter welbionis]
MDGHVSEKEAAESPAQPSGSNRHRILAAYLGLCGWVSTSDTILPNVTAAGLDLSA